MKRSNWIQYVAIFLTVINLCILSTIVYDKVQALDTIVIPPLKTGTGYVLFIPDRATCVDIENELGLLRGDVESISTDPIIGTTIKFKKGVLLDSAKVQTAIDTVKGLIPSITVK